MALTLRHKPDTRPTQTKSTSSSTSSTRSASTIERFWASSGTGEGGGYTHVQTPNLKNCWGSNQDTVSPNAPGGNLYQWSSLITARSNHPGGVNMLFLDGSVKFMKNSINIGTYAALATKAGGEVIDASSY